MSESAFECTVSKSSLSALLSRALGFAKDSTSIASLKSVVLEAVEGGDGITGYATDLVRGLTQHIDADVKAFGRCAVSALPFYAVVDQLEPGCDVRLKLEGGRLHVRAGKARLQLPAIPSEDFPTLPSPTGATLHATVESRDLLRVLAQGSYAAGERVEYPQLGGCLLEFAEDGTEMLVVSTDKLRLAVSAVKTPCKAGKLVMPAKGVSELRRLAESNKDGSVAIYSDGVHAFLLADRVTVSVKLYDLAYPLWRMLLPQKIAHVITAPRDALVSAVRRIAAVSEREDGGAITLTFADHMARVTGASSDLGEGEDFVECECTGNEPPMMLSPRMLVAALDAFSDDDVTIEIAGPNGPLVVNGAKSTECRALLMPRRPATVAAPPVGAG